MNIINTVDTYMTSKQAFNQEMGSHAHHQLLEHFDDSVVDAERKYRGSGLCHAHGLGSETWIAIKRCTRLQWNA